jgi:predicted PolB exonuclease-like 3'-5' exonuclease
MNGNVIVWDIETIPDLHGFAAANNLTGKTEAEICEVMGDKFPKHIYHSIACIGALIAHCENDHWAVDAVGSPHIDEREGAHPDFCRQNCGTEPAAECNKLISS